MSTTVIEPPVEDAVVTTEVTIEPAVEVTAKTKVVKKPAPKRTPATKSSESWIRRAARTTKTKIKKGASRSWRSFRSGLRWLRSKAKAFWNWAKTGIASMGRWLRTTSRTVYNKAVAAARRSWAWIRSGSVRVWDASAGFRAWLASTARGAFGGALGFASLIIFGGKVLAVSALFWGSYLLMSKKGRKKARARLKKKEAKVSAKKAKVKAKETKAKQLRKAADKAVRKAEEAELEATVVKAAADAVEAEVERDVEIIEPEVVIALSAEQEARIGKRLEELHVAGTAYGEAGSPAKVSEVSGRLYLLEQRMLGNGDSATQIYLNFQRVQRNSMGKRDADKLYTWSKVKEGVHAEQKIVDRILAELAAEIEADEKQTTVVIAE